MIVVLRNLILLALGAVVALTAAEGPEEFFESKVRPLLVDRCAACHGEKVRQAKLDLTDGASALKSVVPGDPGASRLIEVVRFSGEVKMPPTGKLAEAEIQTLVDWVAQGAVWPEVGSDVSRGEAVSTDHWAFQALGGPAAPVVKQVSWAKTPIDRFVLARLEKAGIAPPARAGKLALLRRAKFDLHGLPPSVQEIDEFLGDSGSRAFSRLVDRLLEAPQYGEKWGRHWLDVARYADSTGVDEDHPYPHAWRYRDYVVDAFNSDLPFNQFAREQIAGDLLPPAAGEGINVRGVIATGFLGLGPKALAQRDLLQKKYDVVDEQIDTTTKTFLGLTVACSRCHDHKFDPILTRDYYALASIFASTKSFEQWDKNGSESLSTPLVPEEQYKPYEEHQAKIGKRKAYQRNVERFEAERYRLNKIAPHVAERMLAARAAYGSGTEPDDLASWVAFLKPRPDAPAYLKPWHSADDVGAKEFAEASQAELLDFITERVEAYEKWFETEASEALADLPENSLYKGLVEDGAPFEVADDALPQETQDRLAKLEAEVTELEDAAPPEPPMANGVAEDEPVEQHVFVRGSYKNPGDRVVKRFPLVLNGGELGEAKTGSGRRELAEWIASEKNPLTARVFVNRVWTWHFGEGIVRTPSNFGIVGERPTHPELLDHLARTFIESGWSIKALQRLIMNSSAYQMTSAVSDQAFERDPENRLWSRFKRRRLTVEELRDSYLALGGTLDMTLGGNLDDGSGEIPEFMRNNRRLDPDDYNRRSLYIPVMRNKVPFIMGLFDFGDATTTMGKRTVTNVAPQALYAMNSRFASRSASQLADRLIEAEPDVSKRIEKVYLMALARKPAEAELTDASQFLRGRGKSEKLAWTSFCKMLLASNEFHYID